MDYLDELFLLTQRCWGENTCCGRLVFRAHLVQQAHGGGGGGAGGGGRAGGPKRNKPREYTPSVSLKYSKTLFARHFKIDAYTSKQFSKGNPYVEQTLNGTSKELESTTFKSITGNESLGTDGSHTWGNDFISIGEDIMGNLIIDISLPVGGDQYGTTITINEDQLNADYNSVMRAATQNMKSPAFNTPLIFPGFIYGY
jgi:hypothetical protein